VVKARLCYARLAKALVTEGKNEKAVGVLDRCMEALPVFKFPIDPYFPELIDAYFAAGDTTKALSLTKILRDHYFARLDYFLKQNPYVINSAEYEIQSAIQYTSKVAGFCVANGSKELGDEMNKKLEAYYADYVTKLKGLRGKQER